MAAEKPPLAIIIVSWNVVAHLDRCLTSLKHALTTDEVEAVVWVIDNGSADDTVEMVRERHPWAELHTQERNLGYVRANNLGLTALLDKAEAIWLLNPDTLVPEGAIRTLLTFLRTHPKAGLVGPKLLNADGSLQECAFRFPGLAQTLFSLGKMPDRLYYTALNGRYAPALFEQRDGFKIDHPLGAAMLARADAIRDVGLLDDGFFMYCEEIDWAWRMRKAGWQTWLVPSAEVTHIGGASSQQARPATTAYLWESRARLYLKHRGWLTRALVRGVVLRTFSARHAQAASADWAAAYGSILAAWRSRSGRSWVEHAKEG